MVAGLTQAGTGHACLSLSLEISAFSLLHNNRGDEVEEMNNLAGVGQPDNAQQSFLPLLCLLPAFGTAKVFLCNTSRAPLPGFLPSSCPA